jgi:acetyl-CoA carboxylase beta subunit
MKPQNWQKRKKDMSKQEKAKPSVAQETTAELQTGVLSTKQKKKLMRIVSQSHETNLDIAERIRDLIDDITMGVWQEQMSANDVIEYIEEYIDHELQLLIFKLENGIK